ncbi:MAG: TonB-dependent receptor [Bacteroidales bacterium]|jgi:TonB-linked SusC/RagA family outer membrane protein|nr:TonB-dependent receptor [Bacteroidales bacterium]
MKKQTTSQISTVGSLWRRTVSGALMLALTLWCAGTADAQSQRAVTGVVTDAATGETLPGVNVHEKNTRRGVVADLNGAFSFEPSRPECTLVFSFVGYKTQEKVWTGQPTMNVALEEDLGEIGEVVIVGYGTQTKESFTGAISSIQATEIRKSSATSFGNALQGRITGLVSVQSAGGMPGMDDATLLLRGAATINGAEPLILIDGIPRETIRTIDINEVETVSVLKDASATAVFGVRGANGVIIITTKRGHEGKAELSFSASQEFSSFTRQPERLSSTEYIDLRNEAYLNRGIPPAYPWYVRERFADPLVGLDPADPDYALRAAQRQYMYPNHYYYGEVFRTWAPETRFNANVRGGTHKVRYYVNVGYINQGGHLNTEPKSQLGYNPAIKLDRWSFRTNMDYDVNDFMKAKINIGTYIEKQNTPPMGAYGNVATLMRAIFQETTSISPLSPGPYTSTLFDDTTNPGRIIKTPVGDASPFTVINRRGYAVDTRINLNSTFELDFDFSRLITEGLTMKTAVSYDVMPRSNMQAVRSERDYTATVDYLNDRLVFSESDNAEQVMTLSRSTSSSFRVYSQWSVNYQRTFDGNTFSGLALVQRDAWEGSGAEIPYNLMGMVGRLAYNYRSRYFVELNAGYNGSEQFAPDNRFGFFPALSAGWALSNENFLKEVEWIDFLKIRASYGKVGNDKLGSARFLYLDNIKMGGTSGVSGLGMGRTVNINLIGNPNLQWEQAVKTNLGIDFTLFEELRGAIDWFMEKRSNILLTRGMVPSYQGLPSGAIAKANLGKVKNSGIELELSYRKELVKELFLYVKGNIGTNRNQIEYLDEAILDESYAYSYRSTGHRIGQMWGLMVDWDSPGKGYWTSQKEIDESTLVYDIGVPHAGDLKYLDLSHDDHISEKDYAPIGDSSIPGLTYGIDIGLNYKGIDASVFFSGIGKYSGIWEGSGVYEFAIGTGTYYGYHKNAWTEERYLNGDKITYPALSPETTPNHTSNDFFLQNRSFFRLKNAEIGYTLPDKWTGAVGVKSLRLYVKGQNLFLWDKLKLRHQDPEKSDPRQYPLTRMVGCGIHVTF